MRTGDRVHLLITVELRLTVTSLLQPLFCPVKIPMHFLIRNLR